MLTNRRVLDSLKQIGITHIVGLPDNSTAALFHALADDPDIELVSVTREGEAFGTAAGLWMGGKTPLVLIQNTGLLESGDALRGMVTRLRLPILCCISYRGYKSLPPTPPERLTPDDLSWWQVDSVATLLEPTLHAWNLPYELVDDDKHLGKIQAAYQQAQYESRPTAIIIAETIR